MTYNRHKLVHAITPRYTLFSLKRIDVAFDMFEGELYWQGVVNYGLWVFTVVLVLLVMIMLRALQLKAMCLNSPDKILRHKIKKSFNWGSIIAAKLSVLGLIVLLMGYGTWDQFNKKLVTAPLHNTACTIMEKLGPLQSRLENLLKQGEAANAAATEVAGRYEKAALVAGIPTHFSALEAALPKLTEPTVNATAPLKEICLPEKKPSKIAIKGEIEGFIIGVILCIWTIALSLLILYSFELRSSLIMTVLCFVALPTVIMWGVVASVSYMGYLAVADFCYNPLKPTTVYVKKLNAAVSSRLVKFYLDCQYKHPFMEEFAPLKPVLEELSKHSQPLEEIFETPLIKRHGGYAKKINSEVMESLKIAGDIADSKCPDSQDEFDAFVNLPCRRIFWSLATLFVVAIFNTVLFTAFMMVAMRIRKFVYKFLPPKPPPRPEDTCPHTCPGPPDPMDEPQYHLPPKPLPPTAMECPPSCKAFPKILRRFTEGLSKEMAKRAEAYACDPECDKIYLDEDGKPIPPDCIVVTHKSVETENAYMCTKSASRKLRDEKELAEKMKMAKSRKTSKRKTGAFSVFRTETAKNKPQKDVKPLNEPPKNATSKNVSPKNEPSKIVTPKNEPSKNVTAKNEDLPANDTKAKMKSKAVVKIIPTKNKTTNNVNTSYNTDNNEKKKSNVVGQPNEAKTCPSMKPVTKKSPCVPACDDSKGDKCGFSVSKRNNTNVKDAYLGQECRDCPCSQKRRSRRLIF